MDKMPAVDTTTVSPECFDQFEQALAAAEAVEDYPKLTELAQRQSPFAQP